MKKKRGKDSFKFIKKDITSELKDKRGASFGTIVSIIGAILIALGFAWLLATNWHQIPNFLKVIILVGLTIISYVIAIVLREKDYPGIAKSLFVIGALLYTLSVFLIAQLFHLLTSMQISAWLLLLSWVGVVFSAYFFTSYTTLIIALAEFLFWIQIQFFALMENSHNFSFVMAILLFLAAGIFFYGLGLLHRAYEHKFSKLYIFWTAFYFLVISYVLSFQYTLQGMCAYENSLSGSMIIFLVIFGIISFLLFVSGIMVSSSKRKISGKVN